MEKVFLLWHEWDYVEVYASREKAQKEADALNAGNDRKYFTVEEREVIV